MLWYCSCMFSVGGLLLMVVDGVSEGMVGLLVGSGGMVR